MTIVWILSYLCVFLIGAIAQAKCISYANNKAKLVTLEPIVMEPAKNVERNGTTKHKHFNRLA